MTEREAAAGILSDSLEYLCLRYGNREPGPTTMALVFMRFAVGCTPGAVAMAIDALDDVARRAPVPWHRAFRLAIERLRGDEHG